ncbi:hypothetical protein VULLAG_LOCUS8855 [Vulpes lagopus]
MLMLVQENAAPTPPVPTCPLLRAGAQPSAAPLHRPPGPAQPSPARPSPAQPSCCTALQPAYKPPPRAAPTRRSRTTTPRNPRPSRLAGADWLAAPSINHQPPEDGCWRRATANHESEGAGAPPAGPTPGVQAWRDAQGVGSSESYGESVVGELTGRPCAE